MSTADNSLEYFIAKALEYGREQFDALSQSRRQALRLGVRWFHFAESEELLGNDALRCFGAPSPAAAGESSGAVYADYSGWHMGAGFADQVRRKDNQIEFDASLARRGWRASYNPERNSWDLFDTETKFGVRLLPGRDHQAEWEATAPLAHLCRWMSEANGLLMLHAASIAHGSRGALLVGSGGAGKSGTTLGGMIHGLSSAGDDYTLIAPGRAEAAYCTVKQDPSGLARLGLPSNLPLNWQGKAVFRPEEIIGKAISRQAPVNVILLPQIGAERTSFSPIDSAMAFKILTFSTLAQLGSGYERLFRACAPLVRDLPAYRLHLSGDPKEVADALTEFLESRLC